MRTLYVASLPTAYYHRMDIDISMVLAPRICIRTCLVRSLCCVTCDWFTTLLDPLLACCLLGLKYNRLQRLRLRTSYKLVTALLLV
jgi:hypothetical protein